MGCTTDSAIIPPSPQTLRLPQSTADSWSSQYVESRPILVQSRQRIEWKNHVNVYFGQESLDPDCVVLPQALRRGKISDIRGLVKP